jgi:hypothetical protein
VSRPSPPGDGEPGRDLLARARELLPPEVDVVELAGAVALSACSPSHDDIHASAAHSKAAVFDVSNEVLDRMTELGQLFGPAEGVWRNCRDKPGWLSYFISGRLDPAPESRATEPLVDQVTAALAPSGYRFGRVHDHQDLQTMEAVKGEVNVQLTGYTDDPYVLFDISGGCVEVADLDEVFRYEPPETVR